MRLQELVIPVKIDKSGVESGINGISGLLTGLAKTVAVGAGIAIGGAIALGVESSIRAGRFRELNLALEAVNKNLGLQQGQLQATVKEMRLMGIEAVAAQQQTMQLASAGLDHQQSLDLVRRAQDLAVVSGENSTETANRFAHAITTQNIEMLRNLGIQVDANEAYRKHAELLGKSTTELTRAEKQLAFYNEAMLQSAQYAGLYEMAMKEPVKMLRSIPRLIDDILIQTGMALEPVFAPLAEGVYLLWRGLRNVLLDPNSELFQALNQWSTNVGDWLGENFLEPIRNLDWDELVSDVEDFFTGLQDFELGDATALFVDWLDNVDWYQVTNNALTYLNDSFIAIRDEVSEQLRGVDWNDLGRSVGEAFMEGLAGAIEAEDSSWESILERMSENRRAYEEENRQRAEADWAFLQENLSTTMESLEGIWRTGWEQTFRITSEVFTREVINPIQVKLHELRGIIMTGIGGAISGAFGGAVAIASNFESAIWGIIDAVKELRKQLQSLNLNQLGSGLGTGMGGWGDRPPSGGGGGGSGHRPPPRRASGGAVIGGQPYKVAEFYRPEIFIPNENGRVEPMDKLTDNRDGQSLDEDRIVRLLRDALLQARA